MTTNLSDRFNYDPISGDLTFKMRPRESFGSNQAYNTFLVRDLGKVAGSKSTKPDGSALQVTVCVDYKRMAAHHVIWSMLGRVIPKGMVIDHIDNNPWNNSLSNLRLATRSQNNMNRSMDSRNKSGFKGVSWSKECNKWVAQIGANKKHYHLGVFDDPQKAHEAYVDAAKRLHKEFAKTCS